MWFDGAQLLVSKPEGIALETRTRKPIANVLLPRLTDEELRKLDYLHSKRGARWEPRKPHTQGYNCAGHVWASRRTSIIDEAALHLILQEDGYRRLRNREGAVQGDLVLYWNRTTGGQESWLHVGVVSELRREIILESDLPAVMAAGMVPWVLSKWSPDHGEWLHRYNDVPWEREGLRIDFVTERP